MATITSKKLFVAGGMKIEFISLINVNNNDVIVSQMQRPIYARAVLLVSASQLVVSASVSGRNITILTGVTNSSIDLIVYGF